MEILGLIFAGTATAQRPAMARFVEDVLGLEPIAGAGADFFAMPDGTTFAVAGPRGGGEESRTIGFLVADLDAAVAELRAAGVELDDAAGNERQRYAHFHAPDGKRYELVEEK
jgi:catechol 2,3-dioxygenase-like lactoylglutathione lyase family enzyme